MGEIGSGLNEPFRPQGSDFVENQCEKDGQRECHHDFQETDDERILDQVPKGEIIEKCFEILEPYPRTEEDPLVILEFPKRHGNPINGYVAKRDKEQNGRNQYQIVLVIPLEAAQQGATLHLMIGVSLRNRLFALSHESFTGLSISLPSIDIPFPQELPGRRIRDFFFRANISILQIYKGY
jgi:hypothetical protein